LSRKQRNAEQLSALEPFLDEGLIDEVLHLVKSGKEATVYCCRASSSTGGLVAAKVYRSREQRSFKNDSRYREGRPILDSRARRAVAKGTRFGREAGQALWLIHEYEVLTALQRAETDVPRPIRAAEQAILIEYFGDESGAAPPLYCVELRPDEARRACSRLLWNIEQFLHANWVHGDLSPYNILYWQGTAWVIDFPQAVDARANPHARDLLHRDIQNVCGYFEAYGIRNDPERITRSLWQRYRHADL
jgi:RIO kinase 1